MQPFSKSNLLCGCFAVFAIAMAPNRAMAAELWEVEALLLYNSGSPEVNDLRARSTGNTRLGGYAKALEILFQEPREEANVLRAKKVFDQLFEINGKDDVGMAAAYYLARISHKHLDEPDLESARLGYRYLFETYPGRFFGELAFLKFILVELYEREAEESIGARLESIEERGKRLTIPEMQRGFHRSMGEAYRVFELSEAKAYKHLRAAYEIEAPVPETQIELMLSVAELAEAMGDVDVAISALEDFLRTAKWDDRLETVAVRLADLKTRGQ